MISKRNLKMKVGLFPEKFDVVKGNFSYASYFEDACATEKGIYEGYFKGTDKIDLIEMVSNDDYELPKELADDWTDDLKLRFGNLNDADYVREMKCLSHEFVSRILAGEDINSVDIDISKRMEKLAIRNEDGSYNMRLYEDLIDEKRR